MKIAIYLIAAAVALCLGLFIYLSIDSRKARETGLLNGKLRPCPGTPNCVVSEDGGKDSYIEPLAFSGEPGAAWEHAKADDMKTDPAGNAGDRIACGLIVK